MKLRRFQKLSKKILFCSLIAVDMNFAAFASVTEAGDMPTFRQGMWEFNRTIQNTDGPGKSQTMTVKKCTSPTEDMKKQNEMLTKGGCQLSSVSKKGNTYSFTADCKIQGVAVQSKSIMTVENDSAYSVKVESRSAAQDTKEVLLARRTGDCTK